MSEKKEYPRHTQSQGSDSVLRSGTPCLQLTIQWHLCLAPSLFFSRTSAIQFLMPVRTIYHSPTIRQKEVASQWSERAYIGMQEAKLTPTPNPCANINCQYSLHSAMRKVHATRRQLERKYGSLKYPMSNSRPVTSPGKKTTAYFWRR